VEALTWSRAAARTTLPSQAALQHVVEGDQEPVGIERLHQEIERAFAHRLDRAVEGSVGGDDHHGRRELARADVLQYVEPVHVGQAQVEQHRVGRIALDIGQGLAPRHAMPRPERPALEIFKVNACHRQRVFDQQHVGQIGIRHNDGSPGIPTATLTPRGGVRQ
jgi:hypothetical protein